MMLQCSMIKDRKDALYIQGNAQRIITINSILKSVLCLSIDLPYSGIL